MAKGPTGEVAVHIDGPQPEQLVVAHSGQTIVVRQESGIVVRGPWGVPGDDLHPGGGRAGGLVGLGGPRCRGRSRWLRAETASGDIRAGRISGDAEVKTASGDVRLGDVGGRVRVSSASGAVRLGSAGGGANVNTASGDVTVGSADGPVAVKTASGSVDVGRLTGAGLSVKTVSGDFTVGIPSGTELGFEARTMSGRVVLPEPRGRASSVERSARLDFKSVSGDLRVKRV